MTSTATSGTHRLLGGHSPDSTDQGAGLGGSRLNNLNNEKDSRQETLNKAHGYPPGSKVQVELDALAPEVCTAYQAAVSPVLGR